MAEEFNFANLNGSNGFSVAGSTLLERVGASVSVLEDFNGDGIDDVAFGAPGSVASAPGAVHVVFGQTGAFPGAVTPSDLNGSNGLTITRANRGGRLGFAVGSAGDVNGDGVGDLIVGAPADNPKGEFDISGRSYVIFGRQNQPFPNLLDVDALDSTTGFAIDGAVGDRAGASVSSAGDVNGDGIGDLIIGAPDNNRAYILYGRSGIGANTIDLAALDNSNGVILSGVTDDFAGATVRNIGDFNGDGFDDVAIASPTARVEVVLDASGTVGSARNEGRVYVVFGGPSLSPNIDLSALNGNDGFVFQGNGPGGNLIGSSVDGAGDFNNDGLADLIVGARGTDPNGLTGAGQAYIIYGQQSITSVVTPNDLNSTNGLVVNGISGGEGLNPVGDNTGAAVSGIGDVNRDGVDDVMILAPNGDANGQTDIGRSFIVYGRTGNSGGVIELNALGDGEGAILNGINPFDGGGLALVQQDGASGRIDGGGDINGDGVPDIVVGSPSAEPVGSVAASSGQGYVVFSSFSGTPGNSETPDLMGTEADDVLSGTPGDDRILGLAGNDIISGNLGLDTLFGDEGNDSILSGDGNDILVGSLGNDSLTGEAGDDVLFGNVGTDVLEGSEGSDLLYGGKENDTLNGGNGNDLLAGNLGDDLLVGGAGGDRFDFLSTDGRDAIADFEDSLDIIGLEASLTFADLAISQIGADTQIQTGTLFITVRGIEVSQISEADFAFVL